VNALSPTVAVSVRTADLGDPRERSRVDAFVIAHPDGTVFHRPQWSLAVERGTGQRAFYLVAERAGAIVGLLPLTMIRSALFGNALVSAGFGTGGGILADAAAPVRALAEAGWSMAERFGCPSLELRGGPFPPEWTLQEGVYSNFARDLPGGEAALFDALPRRQRAEVRRARDFGLIASADADDRHLKAHFRVYGESVRNLGTPVFPGRLFVSMVEAFEGEADIVMIWKDDRPLASLLTFYFKGVCQPYWGGGTAEAREYRANDLVYFEAMRRGLDRGCTRADFGRSKVGTGPWKRKKIWDFEERPLVYATRTAAGGSSREVNPLSPKYRLQVAAWQKLPLWLANRIGPVIARGLG
jgi:FemAB-related protein (PEP-CTERM system-associated)